MGDIRIIYYFRTRYRSSTGVTKHLSVVYTVGRKESSRQCCLDPIDVNVRLSVYRSSSPQLAHW